MNILRNEKMGGKNQIWGSKFFKKPMLVAGENLRPGQNLGPGQSWGQMWGQANFKARPVRPGHVLEYAILTINRQKYR